MNNSVPDIVSKMEACSIDASEEVKLSDPNSVLVRRDILKNLSLDDVRFEMMMELMKRHKITKIYKVKHTRSKDGRLKVKKRKINVVKLTMERSSGVSLAQLKQIFPEIYVSCLHYIVLRIV